MTNDEKLLHHLMAIAPMIRVKQSAIPDLINRLNAVGIGIDSQNGFAMTSRRYAGIDVADFILNHIRPRGDAAILFEQGAHVAPAKADLSGLTATQKLSYANSHGKPVTSL